MTILVTGGTGYVGRNIVAALRVTGREVRLLNRSIDSELERAGAVTVCGSILEPADLRAALSGCEAVFHCAGRVDRSRAHAAAMRRLHVQGTQAVVEFAARARVRRVVYVSTSGAVCCTRNPEVLDENAPYSSLSERWPYFESKIEAERVAFAAAREKGVDLICLNPSLILGPGDVRDSSTGDVLKVLQRRLPGIPSGGLSFVDVRDVASVAVAALERGRPGDRYLLGAANWTLQRFFGRIGELAGVPVPRLRIPDGPARLAARTIDPLFRALGRPSPLDLPSVEMSQVFWYVNSSRARRELGFVSRIPDETLRDTIDDLRRRHELP